MIDWWQYYFSNIQINASTKSRITFKSRIKLNDPITQKSISNHTSVNHDFFSPSWFTLSFYFKNTAPIHKRTVAQISMIISFFLFVITATIKSTSATSDNKNSWIEILTLKSPPMKRISAHTIPMLYSSYFFKSLLSFIFLSIILLSIFCLLIAWGAVIPLNISLFLSCLFQLNHDHMPQQKL